MKNIITVLLGVYFGLILLSSEVVSWYRIQEMFWMDNFHMYGVIGSAIATGALSVWLLRKYKLKDINGNELAFKKPSFKPKSQITGGIIFGLGWAIVGACPGPLFALFGAGYWIILLVIAGALLGVFTLSKVKDKLPE
jgi:uncharacterized membrane protein YedE/YeeE